MAETKIEWATHTSNWLAGCTKVSPACTHCYAEGMTRRLASGLGRKMPQYQDGVVDLDTGRWTGRVAYNPDALERAFLGLRSAKKPRRVFCNSMSDTFHQAAPVESLRHLAQEIHDLDRDRPEHDHVVMLLTKRPQRLLDWQREYFGAGLPDWVWVGCTVEDQQRADKRVPVLLQVHASVRFLSCEPLVGPLDLRPFTDWRQFMLWTHLGGPAGDWRITGGTSPLHWVIAGGESGPKARPSHPDWFCSLRDQCVAAGVPFHFKQWGEYADLTHAAPEERGRWPGEVIIAPDGRWLGCGEGGQGAVESDWMEAGGAWMSRVGKKAAGRLLDGRTWDEVPT